MKLLNAKRLPVLLVVLAILALAMPSVSANWDNEISPTLAIQLEGIETTTADARGLAILEPVSVYFMGPEEREMYYSGGQPSMWMRHFFAAFDFIPLDVDLGAVSRMLDAQTESGGFYMHGSNEITVMLYTEPTLGDDLPLRERIVYAHEFTHALQDQHFDLGFMLMEYAGNDDEARGVIGLIEGDAVFTEQLFADVLAETDPRAKEIMSFDILGFGEYGANIPDIYRELTYHKYLDGMNFVKQLYTEGGWTLVNAAYDDPPRSSEQILHPERYLNGDWPVAVTVGTVAGGLGTNWEIGWSDTFGEFYLRQYLYTQLDTETANAAAEGWGGDQYVFYVNWETQDEAWALAHVWDTPADRDEYAAAFGLFAASRLDAVAFALDDNTNCWKDATGETLCLRQDVEKGTITVSAPTLTIAQQLLDAQ